MPPRTEMWSTYAWRSGSLPDPTKGCARGRTSRRSAGHEVVGALAHEALWIVGDRQVPRTTRPGAARSPEGEDGGEVVSRPDEADARVVSPWVVRPGTSTASRSASVAGGRGCQLAASGGIADHRLGEIAAHRRVDLGRHSRFSARSSSVAVTRRPLATSQRDRAQRDRRRAGRRWSSWAHRWRGRAPDRTRSALTSAFACRSVRAASGSTGA